MANISAIATKITANADNFNQVVGGVEKRLRILYGMANKKAKVSSNATVDVPLPAKMPAKAVAATGMDKYDKGFGSVGKAARQATAPVTDFVEGLLRLKSGAIWNGISAGINTFKKLGDSEQLKSASRGLMSLFSMRNIGSGISSSIGMIGSMAKLAVLPILGLVAGLAVLVLAAINQGMAFRNAAIEVGETTENYANYATALKLLGVSADDAKASILNLANSINDAKFGDKIKADTFKNLGVELNNSTPLATFKAISESMNKIGNSTERAYVAYKIFGDKAGTVLPLLGMQKEELDKILGSATRLGTVMDDKQSNQIEVTNIKFREMKEMLLGIGMKIATAIMPAIIVMGKMLEKVTENGVGLGSVFKSFGKIAVTAIWLIQGGFITVMQLIGYFKLGLNTIAIGFLSVVKGIVEGTKYLSDAMGDLSPFGAMTETLDKLTESVEYYKQAGKDTNKGIEELAASRLSLSDMNKMISDAGDGMDKFAKSIHKNDDALRDLATKKKLFEAAMQVEQDVLTPLDEFQSKIKGLDVMLDAGVLKWDAYSLAIGKAVIKLEEATHMNNLALPSANRLGSADAASAVTKANAEHQLKNAETPQRRIERLTQQSVSIQGQIAASSAEVAKAMRDRQPVKLP